MKVVPFWFCLLWPLLGLSQRTPPTRPDFQADFVFFWETVRDHYAYFPEKQTDWARVRQYYQHQLDTLTRKTAFVRVLENALGELYDPHATLGTNRRDSWRLVPSGTDLWLTFRRGQAVVGDVRRGLGAARVGIRPGMRVLTVNGVAPTSALAPLLGHCQREPDSAALRLVLNQLLAGNHQQPRVLRLQAGTQPPREYRPDEPENQLENVRYPARVTTRRYGQVGYLKINNCLYDNSLIADFDQALTALADTRALVLDLRETPSGGNTSVARAIIGRFITREQPYQKHELPEEQAQTGIRRSWLELASPRPGPYHRPLVVLAGHWTGSMGEGLVIGLATLPQVRVAGTELAGLRGAVYTYTLPRTGIRFNIPVERLYQVSGSPREAFRPRYYVRPELTDSPATDAALATALRLLR